MRTRRGTIGVCLLVSVGVLAAAPASAAAGRDALRDLVQNCLNPLRAETAAHCPSAGDDSDTGDEARCKATTQVWSRSNEFVAIRDLKMCGCPRWFQHGLAMPLAPVSGIESERLPDGIWRFAWDVARRRIDDPSAIGLAVNSRLQRSQDQLHVHIVELLDQARDRFPEGSTVAVDDLDQVWTAAKILAQQKKLPDYGVLVVQGPGEKFTVLIVDGASAHSPEREYTRSRCQ